MLVIGLSIIVMRGAALLRVLAGHQLNVTSTHPHRRHAQVLRDGLPGVPCGTALLHQFALGLPLGRAGRVDLGRLRGGLAALVAFFVVVAVVVVMGASYRRSAPVGPFVRCRNDLPGEI